MIPEVLGMIGGLLAFVALIRWWDRHEPEPRRALARCFVVGILAGAALWILSVIAQSLLVSLGLLPPLHALTFVHGGMTVFFSALLAAVIAQGGKFFALRRFLWNLPSFTQPVDGIVYALLLGWGAAIPEALATLVQSPESGGGMLPRAVFLLFAGGITTGFLGLSFGRARSVQKTESPVSSTAVLALGAAEALGMDILFRAFFLLGDVRVAGMIVLLASLYLFSRFSLPSLTRSLTAKNA